MRRLDSRFHQQSWLEDSAIQC